MSHSNQSVLRLSHLVPPPLNPVGTGSDEQWNDFIREFGFPFPEDYRSLVNVYGGGGFFEEIGIISPFSPYYSFTERHIRDLEYSYPDLFPVFRTGVSEGLLKIGGDSNGGHLYLLLRDGKAKTLVYGNREHDELHVYKWGLASYLYLMAVGRKSPPSYEVTTHWVRVFKADRPPPTPEQLKELFGES